VRKDGDSDLEPQKKPRQEPNTYNRLDALTSSRLLKTKNNFHSCSWPTPPLTTQVPIPLPTIIFHHTSSNATYIIGNLQRFKRSIVPRLSFSLFFIVLCTACHCSRPSHGNQDINVEIRLSRQRNQSHSVLYQEVAEASERKNYRFHVSLLLIPSYRTFLLFWGNDEVVRGFRSWWKGDVGFRVCGFEQAVLGVLEGGCWV